MDSRPSLVAFVDAGCLGNPGPAAIGVVLSGTNQPTIRIAKWIGYQDNNIAEYFALHEALRLALRLAAKTLHVFSDAEVVVKQMKGDYTCRSMRLYSLNWTCRKLARTLEFSISHVGREVNIEANDLVRSELRKYRRR